MISVEELRKDSWKILALGNYPEIIQSILDFDYLSGKSSPSIVAVISGSGKSLPFFWGEETILIKVYKTISDFKSNSNYSPDFFINFQSGRSCYYSTVDFFENFPNSIGGHIFAEDTPEHLEIDLYNRFGKEKLIAGPSGVGLLIPKYLKLGSIAGTDLVQLERSKLFTDGNTAVISVSAGVSNELINVIVNQGKRVSFAFSIGGDRFPICPITLPFLMAENDPRTEAIVYHGELGGTDEYEIIDLIKQGKLTKPIYAHIAGVIDNAFQTNQQFGHAKALANTKDETTLAKRAALKDAGVSVSESFTEFVSILSEIKSSEEKDNEIDISRLKTRKTPLIISTISSESQKGYELLNKPISERAESEGLSKLIIQSLLGREIKSDELPRFIEKSFSLALDHGPQVSGTVNTITAARAGKDLVSSLASGLLTIGDRFGGAVNQAARNWSRGVWENINAKDFVKENKGPIQGIGHRKYHSGFPDPRVTILERFVERGYNFYSYAKSIEEITLNKKGNLILNFDGALAAIALDILEKKEGFSKSELNELIDIEFFNALFVIPRSIGFAAHFFDQKRNDQGLFRMPNDFVSFIGNRNRE